MNVLIGLFLLRTKYVLVSGLKITTISFVKNKTVEERVKEFHKLFFHLAKGVIKKCTTTTKKSFGSDKFNLLHIVNNRSMFTILLRFETHFFPRGIFMFVIIDIHLLEILNPTFEQTYRFYYFKQGRS